VLSHDGAAIDTLTPAEREVAALAATGLSNLAIATCTGKAVRTVANQMASIFGKLRVGSRRDLAAVVPPANYIDIMRCDTK